MKRYYSDSFEMVAHIKVLESLNVCLSGSHSELLEALKIARAYVASVEGSLRSAMGNAGDTAATPDLRKTDKAIAKAEALSYINSQPSSN